MGTDVGTGVGVDVGAGARVTVGVGIGDGGGAVTATAAVGDDTVVGVIRVGVGVDRVVGEVAPPKTTVRPGSEPVHPTPSATRDRITTASGYPRWVLA
ncbi:MAG: hypothetical protein IIA92_05555 [Chloroflexi bacterium]|nr:hypothetical protein [Chloroflexota bacterium]